MIISDLSQEKILEKLNIGQLLVISTLTFLIENNPQAYPSQSKIAFIIGYSRRQVSRIIAELCKRRLIFKKTVFNKEMGLNETCIYFVAGWLQTLGIKKYIQRAINALTFCKIRTWMRPAAADVSPYILKEYTSIDLSFFLGALALQNIEKHRRRFDIWTSPPPPTLFKNKYLPNGTCSTGSKSSYRYRSSLKKEYEVVQSTTENKWAYPIGHRSTVKLPREDRNVCGRSTAKKTGYPEARSIFGWYLQTT